MQQTTSPTTQSAACLISRWTVEKSIIIVPTTKHRPPIRVLLIALALDMGYVVSIHYLFLNHSCERPHFTFDQCSAYQDSFKLQFNTKYAVPEANLYRIHSSDVLFNVLFACST